LRAASSGIECGAPMKRHLGAKACDQPGDCGSAATIEMLLSETASQFLTSAPGQSETPR